jgi:hypothetical protein
MKLPAATGLGRGVLRRSVETATVEGAAGPVKAERAKGGRVASVWDDDDGAGGRTEAR